MKQKTHFFFDMDKTVAPSRSPIRPEMYDLLSNTTHDISIVSGQLVGKIEWQTNGLTAHRLGENGNHAVTQGGQELWHTSLTDFEVSEVMSHINELIAALPEKPNPEWAPIENRGGQITFSPVGNTAPNFVKQSYDPDRKKRLTLLQEHPFISKTMMACIGGSTSIDYIPKERHKGTNVKRFIEAMHWKPEDCIYFGDGLYPGGNDEFVIGIIDTVLVEDEIDCYQKLLPYLKE